MLRYFRTDGRQLHAIEPAEGEVLPDKAVWIDLAEPTREEEQAFEKRSASACRRARTSPRSRPRAG